MTTLHIGGAPLVKSNDQRRAERRARRERPTTCASVILSRIALPALLAYGLFQAKLAFLRDVLLGLVG